MSEFVAMLRLWAFGFLVSVEGVSSCLLSEERKIAFPGY